LLGVLRSVPLRGLYQAGEEMTPSRLSFFFNKSFIAC